jgi:hypothetical protein
MKKAFVIGSLLIVLTLSLGGSVASKSTESGATYEQLKLFTEVLSIVQNQYVDEVPPRDLIYSAIKHLARPRPPQLVPRSRKLPRDAGGDVGHLRRPRHRDHAA